MRSEWRYAPTIAHWVLAEWSAAGEPATEYGTVASRTLLAVAPGARWRVADAMQDRHGIMPPAFVFDGPPGEQVSLTCGACWKVSFDAGAASSRTCPACGRVEGEADQPAVPGPRPPADDAEVPAP